MPGAPPQGQQSAAQPPQLSPPKQNPSPQPPHTPQAVQLVQFSSSSGSQVPSPSQAQAPQSAGQVVQFSPAS